MSYFSTHNHSSYSNAKVGLDSINRIDEMIVYANKIGLKGLVLSEHELLSSHVIFTQEFQRLKEKGELENDFKVGLGNEIYLVTEDSLEELKENQANRDEDSQFFHFLLIALNPDGYLQLKKLSSLAWESSWRAGLVERTPTFKHNLKEIIQKGDVVASTACLGGYASQMILRMIRHEKDVDQTRFNQYKKQLDDFIEFCIDVFGKEHFYLEIQPSDNEEQVVVNKALIKISRVKGLRYTIATDGHYLTKNDRHSHKVYLKSQNIDREVDAFYDATYIMSEDEVRSYLDYYLTEDEIQAGFDSTMMIYDKVEGFSLHQDTIIPRPIDMPEDFVLEHKLKPAYEQYEFIRKFAFSEHVEDRWYWHIVQEGLIELIVQGRDADKEYFHRCLDRINIEFRELWLISDRLHDRMSAYYGLVEEVVRILWEEGDSIVGISRGSASGYLTNFLSKIVQINALDYNLPHFRHLTAERIELPDVDLDTQANRREQILQALKDKYSERRVLNIATFSTEGPRSALLSAARGLEIDADEVSFLTSLIPSERGFLWSLKQCFYGDKDKKPVTELVNAVSKFEGLMEVSLKIEGLVKSRSVHASGIYIFPEDYTNQNAMMKSSSGIPTTQFSMKCSDEMGALKIDLLTVEAIDKIRATMDMLVEHGHLEDKGSLRDTYNAYLHPDVLVYDDDEMWDKVAENKIPDLFQFDSSVGIQSVKKSRPKNIEELSAANTLMRLMAEGEEQPIDKFVRHKEDSSAWMDEMAKYNLIEKEIEILKPHLEDVYGVASSQEELMLLLMDENISGFTIAEANRARQVVGRKLMDKIPEIKELFFKKGGVS